MITATVPAVARIEPLAVSSPEVEKAQAFIRASKAESTLRGYKADWRDFSAWCAARNLPTLPATPETVSVYIASLADRLKSGSLQRRVNAISQAHQAAGMQSPTLTAIVRATMQGIRRENGSANTPKDAILTEHIRAMIAHCDPETAIGLRDRAALLLGFGGALRRSEVVGLNVEDLTFSREGLVVLLRRSKGDQEGSGQEVVILYAADPEVCPIRAVQAWIERVGITSGPVLRSIRNGKVQDRGLDAWIVARIVKQHAAAAGLDPTKVSGHSLRSGHATSASAGGASMDLIQNQLRHARADQTRKYVRVAQRFRQTSSRFLGL